MITGQYLAGLIDGEGCISAGVQRRSDCGKYYFMQPVLTIKMANCALPLIMQIHKQYKGKLYTNKSYKVNHQDQTSIKWVSREDVFKTLHIIEPYLILKQEQAKLTLWWVGNISITKSTAWGINEAKNIFVTDLKAMKGNMLLPAEQSIERIQACFKNSNVVGIRDNSLLGNLNSGHKEPS